MDDGDERTPLLPQRSALGDRIMHDEEAQANNVGIQDQRPRLSVSIRHRRTATFAMDTPPSGRSAVSSAVGMSVSPSSSPSPVDLDIYAAITFTHDSEYQQHQQRSSQIESYSVPRFHVPTSSSPPSATGHSRAVRTSITHAHKRHSVAGIERYVGMPSRHPHLFEYSQNSPRRLRPNSVPTPVEQTTDLRYDPHMFSPPSQFDSRHQISTARSAPNLAWLAAERSGPALGYSPSRYPFSPPVPRVSVGTSTDDLDTAEPFSLPISSEQLQLLEGYDLENMQPLVEVDGEESVVINEGASEKESTDDEEGVVDDDEVFESILPNPDTLKPLHYERLAEHFLSSVSDQPAVEEARMQAILSGRPSNRFMFYSEATGILRGDTLGMLDLIGATNQHSKAKPIRHSSNDGEKDSLWIKKKLMQLLESSSFWINVCSPGVSEMTTLSKLFDIHPLTAEDILTEETREKCETFANYYFICIRTFDQNSFSPTYLQGFNVYVLVYRECVLSFSSRAIPHAANVLNRIMQLRTYGLKASPDWINYALIDNIVDGFLPVLRFIEQEVDQIDDIVLSLKDSQKSDMLHRIGSARKKVMTLMRLVSTKADMLKTVIKRCGERMAPGSETLLYMGDIQDHVITIMQNLTFYEKTLARSHSNYLAHISINTQESANQTNDVVAKMTALASLLVPLNVITGLWGMNVEVPGQNHEGLVWFFGIILGMVVIAVGIFYVVRRYAMI